jgi:hypothetical protein
MVPTMASKRTAEKWAALSDAYRARLERNGVTRSSYLSGVSLQKARGQAKAEPKRSASKRRSAKPTTTAVKAPYKLPSSTTVARWKKRAEARGVTAADWEAAIRSADSFATVQDEIRRKERLHQKWTNKGGLFGSRLEDDDREDLPVEWGDSWSYYH